MNPASKLRSARRLKVGITRRAAAACWIGISGPALAEGDPPGQSNLAGKPLLREGKGLAALFPRDAGLKGHADVIFADDFESEVLGEGWDETGNKDG